MGILARGSKRAFTLCVIASSQDKNNFQNKTNFLPIWSVHVQGLFRVIKATLFN